MLLRTRRFCTLASGSGRIEYRKSHDVSKPPKGDINLYAVTRISPCVLSEIGSSKVAKSYVSFGLTLTTAARAYHLLAESPAERDLWLCAIWAQADKRMCTLHPALLPIVEPISGGGGSHGSQSPALPPAGLVLASSGALGGTLTGPSSAAVPPSQQQQPPQPSPASQRQPPAREPSLGGGLRGLAVNWAGDSDDDDAPAPRPGSGRGRGGQPPTLTPPSQTMLQQQQPSPPQPPKPSLLQRLAGKGGGRGGADDDGGAELPVAPWQACI